MSQSPKDAPKREHMAFLSRPGAVKKLWIVFVAILALTVIAELFVDIHGHFEIEHLFAFNAWYGFLACAAIIAGAKLLGIFIKRKDTYYDE